MNYRRRNVLTLVGTAGVATLAGCSSVVAPGASSQPATLRPPDGDAARFDRSIAASGDGSTVVIGSRFGDPLTGDTVPAASVFERAGGSWTRTELEIPNEGIQKGYFDVTIADDGSTILVGAAGYDTPDGANAGAVFVFERERDSWHRMQTISGADGDENAYFGNAVALSGDGTTAAVCAPESVFVFERSDGEWSRQATLSQEDRQLWNRFGSAIELSNDGSTALVGGFLHNSSVGPPYVRPPQADTLSSESIETTPLSGGLSAENVMASPRNGRSIGAYRGKAWVFERSDGEWSRQATFVPGDGLRLMMGYSVALAADGSTALVGVPREEFDDATGEPGNEATGSVFVFERNGGSWSWQTKLTVGETGEYTTFGGSVSISADGSTAAVGTTTPANPTETDPASAYVFSRRTEEWSRERSLTIESDDEGEFNHSVAISNEGDTIFLGRYDREYAGSASVFE